MSHSLEQSLGSKLLVLPMGRQSWRFEERESEEVGKQRTLFFCDQWNMEPSVWNISHIGPPYPRGAVSMPIPNIWPDGKRQWWDSLQKNVCWKQHSSEMHMVGHSHVIWGAKWVSKGSLEPEGGPHGSLCWRLIKLSPTHRHTLIQTRSQKTPLHTGTQTQKQIHTYRHTYTHVYTYIGTQT